METNRSIEISRRVYASLLHLYPHEHRAEYGPDMLQLFTDQCRATQKGLGFIFLWLRTLIDLGISALREHLTSPRRTLGLLEAPPNAPLPWKGVVLVLIPGLVFFISQVAQLTGEDWFFILVYRGAYVMILPVLVVWAWTRKFPIWGLIPLGLLGKTLFSLLYHTQMIWGVLQFGYGGPLAGFTKWLNESGVIKSMPADTLRDILAAGLALACLGLGWAVIRRVGIPGRAWAWLAVYLTLVAATIALRTVDVLRINAEYNNPVDSFLSYLVDYSFFYWINYGGFLALILAGGLLARRHGRLAALLPLGFLLPTVIYGRISDEWPLTSSPEFTLMLLVSICTLVYRFVVALAGPLWIVRSSTGQMQKRSSTISLVALVVIQAAFNIGLLFRSGYLPNEISVYYSAVAEQILIGVGVALALSLYQAAPVEQNPQIEAQQLLGTESL